MDVVEEFYRELYKQKQEKNRRQNVHTTAKEEIFLCH